MFTGLLASIEPAAAAPSANQIVQIAGAFGVKPWLLLAQVINFGLVASVLYFFVIRPIQGQLDARAKLIDEGLKRSEESAKILAQAQDEKAQMITDARRQAQQIVEKTSKEMQQFEAKTREEAQREAQQILEAAQKRIQLEQEQQFQKAQTQIAGLVVSLAEKSLEETLTPDQKTRFAERVSAAIKS